VTEARLRPQAEIDLVERTRYYRVEGGEAVARSFFEAAIDALRNIERMPGVGSPRAGELCDVPGLRVRRIAGFPVGWFCFVMPAHVDVVRLLADSQDLIAILGSTAPE
jgi:plasmid stabilization system protein ParE